MHFKNTCNYWQSRKLLVELHRIYPENYSKSARSSNCTRTKSLDYALFKSDWKGRENFTEFALGKAMDFTVGKPENDMNSFAFGNLQGTMKPQTQEIFKQDLPLHFFQIDLLS